MIGKLRRLCKEKSGVAAVEFGMVFPIFLVMLMGTLEFGNYLNQLTMLEKAVRAGGMYASRTDAVVDDVGDLNTTAIQNIVMTGGDNWGTEAFPALPRQPLRWLSRHLALMDSIHLGQAVSATMPRGRLRPRL